jgi:hypothetical protein
LEQPVDTLILGDSSGAYGVLPDVVEEVLGGSAINLCTDGQSAPLADPWMLSTYIEKYGAPGRVILVRTPLTYTRDTPLDCIARIPMPWKFWEEMEPEPSWSNDMRSMVFLFIDKYFPLYSQKVSISAMISDPEIYVKIFNTLKKGTYTGPVGYSHADPLQVEFDSQEMLERIRDTSFSISGDNDRALNSIIELAEQYHFPVYFVNSPIYEQVYSDDIYRDFFRSYSETIDKFIDNETTYLIFEIPMTFEKTQLQNPNHLIHSSAQVYTGELTEQIRVIQDD